MDITTIIGVAGAFLAVVFSAHHAGLGIETFINTEAFVLVFGGTFLATMTSFTMKELKTIPKWLKIAFTHQEHLNVQEQIQELVSYAEKARREGLLSLEDHVHSMRAGMIREMLGMIIDGTEPEVVRKVMENELHTMQERHKAGSDFFNTAGGYAPTMGIIGTVMGVVVVLAGLGTGGMEQLGKGVALAFIVTFYGIAVANLVLLPIGAKLKKKSEEEVFRMQLIFEGFSALQQGENSQVVMMRLNAFVENSQRFTKER